MKLPEELNVELAEAACEYIQEEARVYKGYSGRGMYGASCTGISSDYANHADVSNAVMKAAISMCFKDWLLEQYVGDEPISTVNLNSKIIEFMEDVEHLIPDRQDSLGRGRIYY